MAIISKIGDITHDIAINFSQLINAKTPPIKENNIDVKLKKVEISKIFMYITSQIPHHLG